MDQLLKNPARKDLICFDKLSLIPNFFSKDECENMILFAKNQCQEQLLTRKRVQFDSEKLASWWWERLKPMYKFDNIMDKYGNIWNPIGINSHFRIGIYGSGDKFEKHEDGFYQPSYNIRSFATSMVYLNTVDEKHGGATNFDIGFKIQPKEGLCCNFVVEDLLHCGEELTTEKYLLRTDVMYQATLPPIYEKLFNIKTEAENSTDDKSNKLWTEFFQTESAILKN